MVDLFGEGSTWDKRHVVEWDPNYAVGDAVRTFGAERRQKSLTTVHLRMSSGSPNCWVGLWPTLYRKFDLIWQVRRNYPNLIFGITVGPRDSLCIRDNLKFAIDERFEKSREGQVELLKDR